MKKPRYIAVIDIGKTNAKLALVDLFTLEEIELVCQPNIALAGPPWPHVDTDGIWAFLLDGLRTFIQKHPIDGIVSTTHGACLALLDRDGELAAPILDYEHTGPERCKSAYRHTRPDFDKTGSPLLANGLNLGAQLFWQLQQDKHLLDRVHQIVTYPQYWGHRLSAKTAIDCCSIGCHSDLWQPLIGTPSALVEELGLSAKLADIKLPSAELGSLRGELADALGLDPSTPVLCGIHDSNASLYPHLLARKEPFSVVSTGTWVVAFAVGAATPRLHEERDCLINVDARGQPVASARFMGGREFELIQGGAPLRTSPHHYRDFMERPAYLMPAVEASCGPFKDAQMRWVGGEPEVASARRELALSFYLALVCATCLRLIGARGATIVEGPFTQNTAFLHMLSVATERPVEIASSSTGTSIGAAMLFGVESHQLPTTEQIDPPVAVCAALEAYAKRWQQLLD